MKKLLLSLVGILCSMSLWADPTTIGLTQALSNSEPWTYGAPVYSNGSLTGLSIAEAHGSGCSEGNQTGRTVTYPHTYTGSTAFRKGTTSSEFDDITWVGYTLTIATGYEMNISNVSAKMLDCSKTSFTWKVDILDEDDNVLYINTNNKTANNSKADDLNADVSGNNNLQNLQAGEYKVRLKMFQNGGGKYFVVPYLTLGVSMNAVAQTKYTKPTITQGAYDQPSGTYSVTIDKADGEDDGEISYKIGSGEYQTYTAPIAVAPNTTVTAKVTGSSYNDSDEKEFTTSGKPQLAMPTYTIGAYNFDSNTYSITLAAAQGNIYYTTDNWTTYPQYREAIDVVAGATVKARALQNNMTNSADLVFSVPAAPCGGTVSTPQENIYSDGMEYRTNLFVVPSTNGYIAGNISGGNFDKYIKMRVSRGADPNDFSSNRGFHIHAAPGATLTSVTLTLTNNYSTDKSNMQLSGVYVDDATTTNILPSPIAIAHGSETEATEITIPNIEATDRVVFVFTKVADSDDEPNQIRALISATGTVARDITLGNAGAQGFSTLTAPQNFTVTGAKAYKAAVAGNVVNLTELTGVIPAGEGVIVAGEKGATVNVAYVSDAATADMTGNELQGTTSRIATPANCMALNATAGEFQSYTGAYFPANKAYLVNAAGAKNMRVVFGNTTGIKAVNAEKVANAKFIENGRIVIVKDGAKYNVAGQVIK